MEKMLKLFLTNEMIYSFYFPEYEEGKKFSSPLRDDPNPSLSFYNIGDYDNPYIIWNDFGLVGIRKDGIGFVMALYRISKNQAIMKIWNEMILDQEVSLKPPTIKRTVKVPYTFKYEEITKEKASYWSDRLITLDVLKKYNVKALNYMYKANRLVWEWGPLFLYMFEDDSTQVYRPLEEDRFRSQNISGVLGGYSQLSGADDTLIITSSYKDVMTLSSTGYEALCPFGEASYKTLSDYKTELDERFKNIYVLYDNDAAGRKATRFVCNKLGWNPLYLPESFEKDPSDHVYKHKTFNHLRKVINERIIS